MRCLADKLAIENMSTSKASPAKSPGHPNSSAQTIAKAIVGRSLSITSMTLDFYFSDKNTLNTQARIYILARFECVSYLLFIPRQKYILIEQHIFKADQIHFAFLSHCSYCVLDLRPSFTVVRQRL